MEQYPLFSKLPRLDYHQLGRSIARKYPDQPNDELERIFAVSAEAIGQEAIHLISEPQKIASKIQENLLEHWKAPQAPTLADYLRVGAVALHLSDDSTKVYRLPVEILQTARVADTLLRDVLHDPAILKPKVAVEEIIGFLLDRAKQSLDSSKKGGENSALAFALHFVANLIDDRLELFSFEKLATKQPKKLLDNVGFTPKDRVHAHLVPLGVELLLSERDYVQFTAEQCLGGIPNALTLHNKTLPSFLRYRVIVISEERLNSSAREQELFAIRRHEILHTLHTSFFAEPVHNVVLQGELDNEGWRRDVRIQTFRHLMGDARAEVFCHFDRQAPRVFDRLLGLDVSSLSPWTAKIEKGIKTLYPSLYNEKAVHAECLRAYQQLLSVTDAYIRAAALVRLDAMEKKGPDISLGLLGILTMRETSYLDEVVSLITSRPAAEYESNLSESTSVWLTKLVEEAPADEIISKAPADNLALTKFLLSPKSLILYLRSARYLIPMIGVEAFFETLLRLATRACINEEAVSAKVLDVLLEDLQAGSKYTDLTASTKNDLRVSIESIVNFWRAS